MFSVYFTMCALCIEPGMQCVYYTEPTATFIVDKWDFNTIFNTIDFNPIKNYENFRLVHYNDNCFFVFLPFND